MISVENFNWTLYENLLRPVGLDAWYHYPFGTTKSLVRHEYSVPPWRRFQEHHVLFHFDQEPLWSKDLTQQYNALNDAWSTKLLRVLANSERSEIKREICRTRGMLDWYYFYHGFVALDWFRDSRFVDQIQPFEKVFSSLNHIVRHQRCYRMALTARLLERRLQTYGDISFHGSRDDCESEIHDPNSRLTRGDRASVQQNLLTKTLPIIADSAALDGNFSAHLGYQEYRFWQRSFLHVVNETVFYDHKLHLTEKIFKPIVALRPFLLVAAPGNLAYLRSYGFQTFSAWIDESYDTVTDPAQRMDMITVEVAKMCGKSLSDLKDIYEQMRPVLEYNKKHFFGQFRRVIVDELVDNFETCVRVWNHGRVDGRQRPMPNNLTAVKKLLLQ